MPHVQLRPDWPSRFQRTLRDPSAAADADPLAVLKFEPGVTQEVTAAELELLQPDLAADALREVQDDGRGRIRRPAALDDSPGNTTPAAAPPPAALEGPPGLDALGLDARVVGVLEAGGILTLDDLEDYLRDAPLDDLAGIGPATADVILHAIKTYATA